MATPLERTFRVMGCQAWVQVHGGTASMLDVAEARLRELEQLWSRFLDDSDITRANRTAGIATEVDADTLAVVGRAVDGWRQTNGRFDITTLPALVAAGYTHSTTTGHAAAPPVASTRIGTTALIGIDHQRSTLTVPVGSAIDLGGIGKGMAADITAEDLVEAGATGVVVNVGADIALMGTPSNDSSWVVGIDDPHHPGQHALVLRMQQGGIATSGTTIRRWLDAGGRSAHHLIDPTIGRPSSTSLLTATVLAADTATAEVFATAAMMLEPADAVAMLEQAGLAGFLVSDNGAHHRTASLEAFVP